MKIIDPHHHLWDIGKNPYPWLMTTEIEPSIHGDDSPLKRNYLIENFLEDAENLDLVKSVHVQAEYDRKDPVGETEWLQSVADDEASRGMPNGIVGFCNLAEPDAAEILEAHCRYDNFRGIRHLLNRHEDPVYNYADRDYLEDATWTENFGLLKKFDLSYDLQIYYPQMEAAALLARRYPDTQIILNHAGMPHERTDDGVAAWIEGLTALAKCDTVAIKISGLGMLDHHWTRQSIQPYVLAAIDIFGIDRSMFASNFPVDGLYSTYGDVWRAFDSIILDFSEVERDKLFWANAERYYRI